MVLFEALNLTNTQTLRTIALKVMNDLVDSLPQCKNLSKVIRLITKRHAERGMTWHYAYAILQTIHTSGAFIIPNGDERISVVVTEQPKLRTPEGVSHADMISTRQVPVDMVALLNYKIDTTYYAQDIPLTQFLVYCQEPPGDRKQAAKEADLLIRQKVESTLTKK